MTHNDPGWLCMARDDIPGVRGKISVTGVFEHFPKVKPRLVHLNILEKLPVLSCIGCRPSHIMLDFLPTFVTHGTLQCILCGVIIIFCILMQIYPVYQQLSYLYWIQKIFCSLYHKISFSTLAATAAYMQYIGCTAWIISVERVTAIVHLCVSSIIYLAIKIDCKIYIIFMYSSI